MEHIVKKKELKAEAAAAAAAVIAAVREPKQTKAPKQRN